MKKDISKLPKYKLARSHRDQPVDAVQRHSDEDREDEALTRKDEIAALKLMEIELQSSDGETIITTESILDDAYGDVTRARKKQNLSDSFFTLIGRFIVILLFFVCTIIYAHGFKSWPMLDNKSWYIPVFLSTSLSAWICIQAAHYWKDKSRYIAIFGYLLSVTLILWNLHVVNYAAMTEENTPANGRWAPTHVYDLHIISEINAIRGIAPSLENYDSLTPEAYRRAFHAIPRNEWREYFERYLSPDEFSQVNTLNIDNMMFKVTSLIRAKRLKTWDELAEQTEQPELMFRVQQAALAPYTWIWSRL